MTVRFWDYRDDAARHEEEYVEAFRQVLRSGELILGSKVRGFEAAYAASLGLAHGIGVNSGTDALFLALKAMGVGPGDEVVTVANTAIPTVAAIHSTGARVRFADIDRATMLMDPAGLEAAIGPATKAVVPVHLYGQCADMERILDITRPRGIRVLEDCAQANGARRHGRMAGAMGDAGAYSFYPTKILSTFGDGGMVATSDTELADRVRRIRMYGTQGSYFSVEHGYNSRLDEVHAALLLVRLPRLDASVAERRRLAARYDAALVGAGLTLPTEAAGNTHAYYAYVVRHPERDRVVAALGAAGIGTNVNYRDPIHLMPAYDGLGYGAGALPETEAACREVFSLPLHPDLGDAAQDEVVAALLGVLGR